MQHVAYPHHPGYLYDCPACDAACHCTPGSAECVYEGDHNGTADAEPWTLVAEGTVDGVA